MGMVAGGLGGLFVAQQLTGNVTDPVSHHRFGSGGAGKVKRLLRRLCEGFLKLRG